MLRGGGKVAMFKAVFAALVATLALRGSAFAEKLPIPKPSSAHSLPPSRLMQRRKRKQHVPTRLVAIEVAYKSKLCGKGALRILPWAPNSYFRAVTSAAPYEMIAESSVRRKPRCSRSRAAARIRFI
jgi:hypothetical protein